MELLYLLRLDSMIQWSLKLYFDENNHSLNHHHHHRHHHHHHHHHQHHHHHHHHRHQRLSHTKFILKMENNTPYRIRLYREDVICLINLCVFLFAAVFIQWWNLLINSSYTWFKIGTCSYALCWIVVDPAEQASL